MVGVVEMRCDIFKDANSVLRARWRCPLCPHSWTFHASRLDEIGFFVVHHLVGKHRLCEKDLLTYDEDLGHAIQEYFLRA